MAATSTSWSAASSTGDDPFQNPNIWAQLNGNLRWRGVASSTAVRYYPGDIVEAGDNGYLCHTAAVSQTATTIPSNSSFWNISESGGGDLSGVESWALTVNERQRRPRYTG